MQVKHTIAVQQDLSAAVDTLRARIEKLPDEGDKHSITPDVGHELFKIGTLTDKTPQFHLLARGNPRPETVLVSPLYQISIDAGLRREPDIANFQLPIAN